MYLSELGLYHYRARVYNPHIGRFLQTDPIGYEDQMNLYAYVGNDPMNNADPSGMAQCGTLTGDDCNKALDDADSAKALVDKVAAGISDIAGKMENGEELTAGEQGAIDAVGEKFGDKFTSASGLQRLAKGLGKISKRIGARGEGMTLNRGNDKVHPITGNIPRAYVTPRKFLGMTFRGNKVNFNSPFLKDGSSSTRQRTIIHEGAHLAGFGGDSYKRSGITILRTDDPGALWNNADTYACTVLPGTCGY